LLVWLTVVAGLRVEPSQLHVCAAHVFSVINNDNDRFVDNDIVIDCGVNNDKDTNTNTNIEINNAKNKPIDIVVSAINTATINVIINNYEHFY